MFFTHDLIKLIAHHIEKIFISDNNFTLNVKLNNGI